MQRAGKELVWSEYRTTQNNVYKLDVKGIFKVPSLETVCFMTKRLIWELETGEQVNEEITTYNMIYSR